MMLFKPALSYYLFSSHRRGRGIHNPSARQLIREVFNDRTKYDAYDLMHHARKKYLRSKEKIRVLDLGAGSRKQKNADTRKVRDIARFSSGNPKYHCLLYRMVSFYRPAVMVEAGTSLGLGTLALALGNPQGKVYTIEGDPSSAALAEKLFKQHNLSNITLLTGSFSKMFPQVFARTNQAGFVFLDGHHEEKATLENFETLLPHLSDKSVLVVDDIHWSQEMLRAWNTIRQHSSVRLTIDIFRMGLVFFNPDLPRQTLKIRF
ncbi:MAG: class I SAM-dependent methyltransferase [Bacteroidales bacterium]|nr:class I SAM-dependent methyltransferase [Bacteroidales bacterium]